MDLTVITPTYNRAGYLIKLAKSLTYLEEHVRFEWVVVDDGSSDNTLEVLNEIKRNYKGIMRVLRKENGGKHTALNLAFDAAKGDYLMVVDSDDYLSEDAGEFLADKIELAKNSHGIIGFSGRRGYPGGIVIGSKFKKLVYYCTPIDFRYRYKVKGDMAEVFEREALGNLRFPIFDKEKYCPEDWLWNRLGQKGDFIYTDEIIYICDYLEGGITDTIRSLRRQSSVLFTGYYEELASYNLNSRSLLKAQINYCRFYPFMLVKKGLKSTEYYRSIPWWVKLLGKAYLSYDSFKLR